MVRTEDLLTISTAYSHDVACDTHIKIIQFTNNKKICYNHNFSFGL